MLKQSFDGEQLSKIIKASDIWKWEALNTYTDVEDTIKSIVGYWDISTLKISSLTNHTIKNKSVFQVARVEDDLALRLVDRFIRRIYKVRQSDRNRIIKQLITVLEDSGDYHLLRLDIKDCYENIQFDWLIKKFEEDCILAPECIDILKDIHLNLLQNHNVHGLPRGLSVSATLAELYLEELDLQIALTPNVIYSARYVDDIIIILAKDDFLNAHENIINHIGNIGLKINSDEGKHYSGDSRMASFDYLGYAIEVEQQKQGQIANKVSVTISNAKLNKIKSRIVKSFICHKVNNNISLLKRRIEYLSMLKVVKKDINGNLLAGISHNYQLVTDDFDCLKPLDGFLNHQINNCRYGLNISEKNKIKAISIYRNVRRKRIGNFSQDKTMKIMQAWQNV